MSSFLSNNLAKTTIDSDLACFTRLFLLAGFIVFNAACSSGSETPVTTTTTSDNTSTENPVNGSDGNEVGGSEGDMTDTAGLPIPTDSDTTPDPVAESSPVELLIEEIRLTAAAPIVDLNRKLRGGELLSETENNCIGSFDPAIGEQLTAIDCVDSLAAYNSIARVSAAVFDSTETCQQALASDSVDGCNLFRADITIPVEWVNQSNPAPSQIGTVTPIAGANISYNLDSPGLLTLQHSSTVTAAFICDIDLATASLVPRDPQIGNCRQEIDHILGRLFGFRQTAN